MTRIYNSSNLFKSFPQPTLQRRWSAVAAAAQNLQNSHPPPPQLDPSNRQVAIAYYDKFYPGVYGDEEYFRRIRPALLSPPQYFAIPNPFTGARPQLANYLEELGAFSVKDKIWGQSSQDGPELEKKQKLEEGVLQFLRESSATRSQLPFGQDYYNIFHKGDISVPYYETDQETCTNPSWPGGTLDGYMFDVGSSRKFPKSMIHESGCSSFLYVNGGSLTPVLALDLTPSCSLLDICAGPGTKSLMALISSHVDSLICNDLKSNRVSRTALLFQHYLGSQQSSITHTCLDGRDFPTTTQFDKILVDTPCSNDRESCRTLGNNLFRPERTAERFELFKVQKDLLKRSWKLLKPGPTSALVYSTCSLSPCENDGVVLAAIKELREESSSRLEVTVDLQGLVTLLSRFSQIYKMIITRTGVTIVPNVGKNFGPMFISRIKKTQLK